MSSSASSSRRFSNTGKDGCLMSEWQLSDVSDRYGVTPTFGFDVFNIEPIPIPDDVLHALCQDLEDVSGCFNIYYSNEAEKCEFLFAFLKHIKKMHPSCRLRKELEVTLCIETDHGDTKLTKGKADFAVVCKPNERAAIIVVEAKKEDIGQGTAQCLLQMEASFQLLHRPVFGIVSTAIVWKFFKYDGATFLEVGEWSSATCFILQANPNCYGHSFNIFPFLSHSQLPSECVLVSCLDQPGIARISAVLNAIFHHECDIEPDEESSKRAKRQ